jgi:hypothetical protein
MVRLSECASHRLKAFLWNQLHQAYGCVDVLSWQRIRHYFRLCLSERPRYWVQFDFCQIDRPPYELIYTVRVILGRGNHPGQNTFGMREIPVILKSRMNGWTLTHISPNTRQI